MYGFFLKVSCRFHDLRHTFISRLAESQASDSTVMALAGHVSRKMMERYSHIRMEAKRMNADGSGDHDLSGALSTDGWPSCSTYASNGVARNRHAIWKISRAAYRPETRYLEMGQGGTPMIPTLETDRIWHIPCAWRMPSKSNIDKRDFDHSARLGVQ